jgi:Zinc dependent phospholipase C
MLANRTVEGMRSRVSSTVCTRATIVAIAVAVMFWTPSPASGYSVLAHEANIDALWDSTISKMLVERFPGATPEELLDARAYAYGGCVIQDLGYYPFGSHFFSNLLHYVRTGDFVEALIADAQDIDEYAFALGALGHYAADNSGHPMAVNRAVPLMYPKLKAQFGNSVTYAESPRSHVLVEFSFDVVQVAAGAYAPAAYHSYVGFKVAKPALERAFREIYGIEMKDLFFNEDLAIGTYRHAIATTIPEMTKVAWSKKRSEIMRVAPGMQRKAFVFNLNRKDYDKEFGADYAKPHGFARFLGLVYRVVPKIGPFRSLGYSVPTAEAERLFLASFTETRERYRVSLDATRAARLRLPNVNFDTGRPTVRGEYSLADTTYDDLLDKLADRGVAHVSTALAASLIAYYGDASPLPGKPLEEEKRSAKIRLQLASLTATQTSLIGR